MPNIKTLSALLILPFCNSDFAQISASIYCFFLSHYSVLACNFSGLHTFLGPFPEVSNTVSFLTLLVSIGGFLERCLDHGL